MAKVLTSAWPPVLLLSLGSLFSLSARARAEIVVQVLPLVRGFLGDNVTLECKLQTQAGDGKVTLVTWQRLDPMGGFQNVAVLHPTRGPSYPGNPNPLASKRLEFVAAWPDENLRDASLAVRGLLAKDEANYTCHIATYPEGSKSASTRLRVLAKPHNSAQTQEVPLRLLGQEPVPVANCTSTGGRPPARISWSLNETVDKSQVLEPLSGTFTVTSLLTLIPSSQVDGKNVTCTVEHESFEKPVLLPVTLAVPYPPEVSISGYDDNWYLGHREAALNCEARSNPKPTSYVWSTTTGPLPPYAVVQGNHLLIHSVDSLHNTTFICHVTNTLGTGKAEQTILVRAEPPRDKSQLPLSPKIISLIVVFLVLVPLLVFLIYSRIYKPCRQNRNQHSSSANENVSYSAVNSNASSP